MYGWAFMGGRRTAVRLYGPFMLGELWVYSNRGWVTLIMWL